MSATHVLPEGPPALPVVGHIPALRRDPLSFFRATWRTHPRLATLYLFKTPIILFFRPEHVHAILVQQASRFTNREAMLDSLEVLGDGLLTIDGEAHREQRRLVQPAFRHGPIHDYAEVMTAYTEEMLAHWKTGTTIDVARAMQTLTLRIVAKTLFGIDLEEAPRIGEAFSQVIENPDLPLSLAGIRWDVPFMPYGRRKEAERQLDAFLHDLIESRRRALGKDIVSTLLAAEQETGVSLTNRQVRDHAITFLAAGHETTSNALTWTFYLLSQHPEIYRQLMDEVQDTLDGRTPTPEDLPALPILDRVVLESMRVLPPVWRQARYAQEPFELEGHTFPPGTFVMISQWVTHQLPDVWGDPDVFRPDRWLPEEARELPKGAYFPFGGGPRMCIGMPFANQEIRLILATILQHAAPWARAGERPGFFPGVTLRPRHGLFMELRGI